MFCFGVGAASLSNCVVDWNGMGNGSITGTKLTNNTHGNYKMWENGGGTGQTVAPTRLTVATHTAYTFPNSFAGYGITNTTTGASWLKNDIGAGSGVERLVIQFPNGATGDPTGAGGSFTNITVCGFIDFSPTSGSATPSLDQMILEASYGNYSVLQYQPSPNKIVAHGGGPVEFGPGFTISSATTYFYMFISDGRHITNHVRFYNPTTFTLISQDGAAPNPTDMYHLQWVTGYIGDWVGAVYHSTEFILYEPTDAQVDGIITNQTVATANITRLNVGTLR